MTRWTKAGLGTALVLTLAAGIGTGVETRAEAHRLITNPIATRHLPNQRPIDFGMVYDDVGARSPDGLQLAGWYVPGTNGAVIIAQHGYKSDRSEMLNEAAMLNQHGYGVLITSVRAHDLSSGELITFGKNEIHDLEAWFAVLLKEPDVDHDEIGILGNSMGGSLAIQFAAENPQIKAVVAVSAFSSLPDTIEAGIRYFSRSRLPSFPFTNLITFWAEREGGFHASEIDAKQWIPRISPRPVLLMQGGADVVISKESGQRLYAAAGEPKELWYEPQIGHAAFDKVMPAEYERRVTEFFDKYLLKSAGVPLARQAR